MPDGVNEIYLCSAVRWGEDNPNWKICCGTLLLEPCGGPNGVEDDHCDEQEGFVEDKEEWTINGEDWKMEVAVWVEKKGLFGNWSRPEEVGSRMKVYKWRKKWGRWKWRDECPDVGNTTLEGEYFDVDQDCAIQFADEERWRDDCDNNQQINIDHDGARKYAGKLGGTFRMRVDGRWYEYDNGSPLILD